MADEEYGESGWIRRQPWELMKSTIVWELHGLAVCGVIALVLWLFGGLPDWSFLLVFPGKFAAGPMGELYRTKPPRRRAALAAFLATMTVALLGGAAADWAFPLGIWTGGGFISAGVGLQWGLWIALIVAGVLLAA
ncbi:hypothetical protein ACWDA7_52020 [Streptomyces sp. NPDC001156]